MLELDAHHKDVSVGIKEKHLFVWHVYFTCFLLHLQGKNNSLGVNYRYVCFFSSLLLKCEDLLLSLLFNFLNQMATKQTEDVRRNFLYRALLSDILQA